MADLPDEGVLLRVAPVAVVNGPEYSGDLVCWGDRTSPEIWSRVGTQIQMDAECQRVHCVSCVPEDRDCSVLAAGYSGSFGIQLPDPVACVLLWMM